MVEWIAKVVVGTPSMLNPMELKEAEHEIRGIFAQNEKDALQAVEELVNKPAAQVYLLSAKVRRAVLPAEVVEPEKSFLRKQFEFELDAYKRREISPRMIAVAVKLPSGAIEAIVNYHEVESKIDYYLNAYDNEFKLKANKDIQIMSYMIV
jgi:hypothetical protein